VRELFTEELKLALPRGHALARKRNVTVADLESERLIVMKEGHCLGDQMLAFCERRDMKPNISFRSAQLETIQALVCCGMGISLIPAMAARSGRENAPEYRSLESPRPDRKIVAIWPKQRPLGRAAAEFLKQVAAQTKDAQRRASDRAGRLQNGTNRRVGAGGRTRTVLRRIQGPLYPINAATQA
jgi:LysR family hydrogen peroxide-inducible transcriptional activator